MCCRAARLPYKFQKVKNSVGRIIEHFNSKGVWLYMAGDFNVDLLEYVNETKIKPEVMCYGASRVKFYSTNQLE